MKKCEDCKHSDDMWCYVDDVPFLFDDARDDDNPCGVEGKLFEAKEGA